MRGLGYTLPVAAIEDAAGDPLPDPDHDMKYDCETARGIVFDPGTFTRRRWVRPQDAVIHIFQNSYWGNLQFQIKAIDYAGNTIWFGDGGQQMGAKWTTEGSAIGTKSRYFIENVFEELDAPREWYLDGEAGKLYWMPEDGVDPNAAVIEVSQLKTLISVEGTRRESVEGVVFEQIRFAHTEPTFFDEYEVPSLGDWALYRGGALRFEGSRNCRIYNNIWVNCASSPCFHVGNEENHDQYFNNITVMSPKYQAENHDRLFNMKASGNEIYYLVFPPVRTSWLEKVDNNCFHNDLGRFSARVLEREVKGRREILLEEWQAMGFDRNSVFGDPMFVDPANDDYRVKPESPALKVGFKNFDMGTWGLTDEFPSHWESL